MLTVCKQRKKLTGRIVRAIRPVSNVEGYQKIPKMNSKTYSSVSFSISSEIKAILSSFVLVIAL